MTLDEFVERSPALIAAFVDATRRNAVEYPNDGFALERGEEDWYQELASYIIYVELTEPPLTSVAALGEIIRRGRREPD